MTNTIHDVSLLLGRLKTQIDYLSADARHAIKARQATHEKLELIAHQVDATRYYIDKLEKRIAAVEKPMSQIQQWQQRGIGALLFIGLACAFIGGSVANYWQKILTLFKF